ncbi:MAG: hypothetical protein WAM85_05280 [Terracidiphilus sp.]
MRFHKTINGWKPADDHTWYSDSIKWNAGCLVKLAGLCVVAGGIIAVGVGVSLQVNPFPLVAYFLLRYWRGILDCALLLFVVGVMWDYTKSLETPFQEALMDSLNTINVRLEAIEEAMKERNAGTDSD